jgi:hypothetical protein
MWAVSRVFSSVLSHRPEQDDGGFFVAASYDITAISVREIVSAAEV